MAYPGSSVTKLISQGHVQIGGVEDSTLSGNVTLDDRSPNFLRYDPNGSTRTVTLPAGGLYSGAVFVVHNAGDTVGELLTVQNDTPSTVLALDAGESAIYAWDGTSWVAFPVGAIDFGAGLSTDTISEETTGAGVTVDGALIKDGSAIPAVADPGDGTAIPVTASASIAITTGASGETNTLPDPDAAGIVLSLTHDVDGGGDRVITADTAINQTGNNTITFDAAGEHLALIGVQVGGSLVWRVLASDGVGLTTV